MSEPTHGGGADDMGWPASALTPYIAVSDGRRAIQWYVTVFGARQRGDAYVMPDGSIGHAELAIGNAVLMLAEGVRRGAGTATGRLRAVQSQPASAGD